MMARLVFLVLFSGPVFSGEADIVDIKITHSFDDVYQVSVTLQHEDVGWKHYANGWEVLDENGKMLGRRVLRHPHVEEQPFTRDLLLKIPEEVKTITVRGHDSVHEYGGCELKRDVPREPLIKS